MSRRNPDAAALAALAAIPRGLFTDHPSWHGWRFSGPHLVTPARERVSAELLAHLVHMHSLRRHHEERGLAYQAKRARARRAARRQQLVRVLVVNLEDWRGQHDGGAA